MAEARGIEVFGRGATIVETGGPVESPVRRGPWLGLVAVVLAVLAAVATAIGVVSMAEGQADVARWWAYAAIGCGILGVLVGGAAVVTGRGRAVGATGVALSLVANPWVLTRLLEAVGSLVA